MLFVNTLSEGCRKFSLFHKNVLKASAKMSIEKGEKLCYNKIRKTQEVQTDENLNPQAFYIRFFHSYTMTVERIPIIPYIGKSFGSFSPSPLAPKF